MSKKLPEECNSLEDWSNQQISSDSFDTLAVTLNQLMTPVKPFVASLPQRNK